MSYWKKLDRKYNGNMAEFGRELGASRQLVHSWVKRGYIPAKYAMDVQRITGGVVSAMEVLTLAGRSGKS